MDVTSSSSWGELRECLKEKWEGLFWESREERKFPDTEISFYGAETAPLHLHIYP